MWHIASSTPARSYNHRVLFGLGPHMDFYVEKPGTSQRKMFRLRREPHTSDTEVNVKHQRESLPARAAHRGTTDVPVVVRLAEQLLKTELKLPFFI